MRLRIQLLHHTEAVKDRLQRDGWTLEADAVDSLSACHPLAADEPGTRRRLHRLGLLTSGTLRIEFPVSASGCAARRRQRAGGSDSAT